MRVNLGSGDYPAPDWTNIDAYPGVNPDIVASVTAPAGLPFGDASVDAVYAGHVLEHIDPADLPAALAEIRRVLRPGGRFAAVGPDLDRIDPLASPDLYRQAGAGHDGIGVNPYAPHLWGCTEKQLLAYVQAVFPDARAVPIADLDRFWPAVSRVWWQCAVEADG